MKRIAALLYLLMMWLCMMATASHAVLISYGDATIDRPRTDSAVGYMYIYRNTLQTSGTVQYFNFYSGNLTSNGDTSPRWITPVILEQEADHYIIRGIGASRSPAISSKNYSYAFNLLAGTDYMENDFTFGIFDGRVSYGGTTFTTQSTNMGVAAHHNTAEIQNGLWTYSNIINDIQLNGTIGPNGSTGYDNTYFSNGAREYSALLRINDAIHPPQEEDNDDDPPAPPPSESIPEPLSAVLLLSAGAVSVLRKKIGLKDSGNPQALEK